MLRQTDLSAYICNADCAEAAPRIGKGVETLLAVVKSPSDGDLPVFRQAVLFALAVVAVEIAFLYVPGTVDGTRWLLYMEVARERGVLALYPVVVNQGVDTHDPIVLQVYTTLFKTADFDTVLRVFGAKHAIANVGGKPTCHPPLGIVIIGLARY